MKELKIGERVEVVMQDGSDNVGVVKSEADWYNSILHQDLELELPTFDGTFYGILVTGREPFDFWECKLK